MEGEEKILRIACLLYTSYSYAGFPGNITVPHNITVHAHMSEGYWNSQLGIRISLVCSRYVHSWFGNIPQELGLES